MTKEDEEEEGLISDEAGASVNHDESSFDNFDTPQMVLASRFEKYPEYLEVTAEQSQAFLD